MLKRIMVLLLLVTLVFTGLPTNAFAANTSAAKIQLEKIEGTVKIERSTGKELKARKGMRLINGYTLITSAKSYAYVSLDSTKAVKVDANSKIEIRKTGKKIELYVKVGKLFFNVTKPLKTKETMNIKTSTMTMGIRGTSGIVAMNHTENELDTIIQLYDGKSEIVTASSLSGERKKETITGGEVTTIEVEAQNQAVIKKEKIANQIDIIPGFAAVEIKKSKVLSNKIKKESNLNVEAIIQNAESYLKKDEKKQEDLELERNQELEEQREEILESIKMAENQNQIFNEEKKPDSDTDFVNPDTEEKDENDKEEKNENDKEEEDENDTEENKHDSKDNSGEDSLTVVIYDKITSEQIDKDVIYGIINKKVGKKNMTYAGKFITQNGEVKKIAEIQDAMGNQALGVQFIEKRMSQFKGMYNPFTISKSFTIPEGVTFRGKQNQTLIIAPGVIISGGTYQDKFNTKREINGLESGLSLKYMEKYNSWIVK